MAIIAIADVVSRKFSGYEDPRYPSGFWVGAGQVTGDASGGDSTLQLNFNPATSLFNSQYYSIEQFMISIIANANFLVDMLIANFDLFTPITGQRYTIPVIGSEASIANIDLLQHKGMRGLFLGQASNTDTAQSLSFIIDNTTNEVMNVFVQGYIWGVRSTMVEGGPQRPPTGLYPN